MRIAFALLWILMLAAAFAAGRFSGSPREASVADFREALLARDELTRARGMSAFLERLDPDTLPGAREELEAHKVGISREESRLFLLAWSRFDAPGAFAWARDWKGPRRESLLAEAMYAWGLRDARAALGALDALDDSELRARLQPSIFEGWMRSDDRSGASEAVAAIEDPRLRGRLTFLLAGETMRDGPEAVLRWADSVPPDAPNDYKNAAFSQAATIVTRADPKLAQEWYLLHRERPYSAGALTWIARNWARHHDPAELFDWLRSLPADGERSQETGKAMGAGFHAWLKKDPERAEEWLSAALPDPALDPAVVELIRTRSERSPGAAIEWAGRIDDEDLRYAQTVLAGRSWRMRDPEALQAWLAANDVPQGTAEAILAAGPATPRASREIRAPRARPVRR